MISCSHFASLERPPGVTRGHDNYDDDDEFEVANYEGPRKGSRDPLDSNIHVLIFTLFTIVT